MKEIRLGFPERHLSLFRDAVLLDAGQFCANIDRASDKRSAQFGVELTSVLSFAVFVVAMSSLNVGGMYCCRAKPFFRLRERGDPHA